MYKYYTTRFKNVFDNEFKAIIVYSKSGGFMAKKCSSCGLETYSESTHCDHCGKPFEINTKKENESILIYYIDAIKHYVDFNGRTKRKDYWMFMLVNFIIISVVLLVGIILLSITIEGVLSYFIMIILFILSILYSGFILFPVLSISVRRLHDQDRSGLFLLFNLIPWIGNLGVVILMALPGTPYDNRYGPYKE
jgi:uncharacterized membrane protein YhaH (DUF805 family)